MSLKEYKEWFLKFIITPLLILISFNSSSETTEPIKVNIEILSALIGPTKVNGTSWDTEAKIDRASVALISEMVLPGSGFTASNVASAVSKVAISGSAAPDVVGYIYQKGTTTKQLVKYAGNPIALSTFRNKSQDNYTPRFYAGYSGWPIFHDTRFQIQLWDADILNHDHIAVVELNYSNILEAIEKGEPTWINVAEQSMNQLLYILISVIESDKYTRPKMNGDRFSWN